MQYIAALDYDHLDNGVFLTSLAQSLSQQQGDENIRSIIVHGDSEYTQRIIQTGVMSKEAKIRSVKDLNNRLVALFADQGVSTVGINPSQRKMISLQEDELSLDHSFINSLPKQSVLLLSTLVHDSTSNTPTVIDLPELVSFLKAELDTDEVFLFSKADEDEIFTNEEMPEQLQWDTMETTFRQERIPDEFSHFEQSVCLTSARDFNQLPDLSHSIAIKSSL
ncbi:hypothetical protein [Fodinibius halophilus]|uniref:Uncharacterized protein n=1 Tax=Fodinibius halophilus TaxID=1736908 RepID=A0A6M1SYN9_9BACT|nr:hypothetical protein [Fodinibius halophilus]NGP86729.1 hypothetical protein [Fodinibius halophilus]